MRKNTAPDPIILLKLVADQSRYQALFLLMKAKHGLLVGEIAEYLGMSHSAASHLLGVLHDSRVVSYEKDGRESRYKLTMTKEARLVVKILRAF